MSSRYEYQSDFAKHYIGKGRAEGEASALLRVLAARGFVVDSATEERVRSCHEVALLERWVTRAVTAATLADVFADG